MSSTTKIRIHWPPRSLAPVCHRGGATGPDSETILVPLSQTITDRYVWFSMPAMIMLNKGRLPCQHESIRPVPPVAARVDRDGHGGRHALSIPAHAEVKSLEIIAPAGPGRRLGPDRARHADGAAGGRLASGIQVKNIAGAGGTIGLAQFVTSEKKKGDAILVGGLVMVGAILTNKAPVTLDDVTPLARLTGEYELIVVPADSPIKTMADLVAKLKADPGSVSWGGGSTGGTDHILAGLIAKAAGVDPAKRQLHRPLGRRRGAVLDPRRPRHRRHQRL